MMEAWCTLLAVDWFAALVVILLFVLVIALCWMIQRRYEREDNEEFERWSAQRFPDYTGEHDEPH